MIMKIAVWPKG